MIRARQWPVQRARGAILLGLIVTAGAFASLAYCFPAIHAAPVMLVLVLALAWHFRHSKRLGFFAPKALLRMRETGHWELTGSETRSGLYLVHAWPAFAWMTLRFHDPAAIASRDIMFEVTVWKSGVSPDAWRQLNVIIASRLATFETAAPPGA